MAHIITIHYQEEQVTIEPIIADGDVQFRVNFDQPVLLEKELNEVGEQYWIEVGAGATVRAQELGALIDRHPELI
ncbi:hypothetical protein EXU57_14125 [Segetibacter sp. 3557_3]|uniref:hypothetical protein n=1 Tax=Segetibacter sp. 3557_3 TaxID=2547429 RepID=UPI001058A355|nr:hypothetical protein [Segetibacter sp. 3557_3]TDH25237.1 hypothetical protein EXU57_14125 [Segetibacter sp. 3557_3]